MSIDYNCKLISVFVYFKKHNDVILYRRNIIKPNPKTIHFYQWYSNSVTSSEY